MASKTKSGLFLPLIVVSAVAIAVFGFDKVVDTVTDFIGDIAGQDVEEAVALPDGERGRIKACTAEQLVDNRRCKGLPVVVIDARDMPYIAHNITSAWREGKPALLTRVTPDQKRLNRRIACNAAVKASLTGSCDEYAFAVAAEGGANARVEGVPAREQREQAKAICATLNRSDGPKPGEQFLVVIVNPGHIKKTSYDGTSDPSDPPELC